jgi:hypothetical protein
MFNSLSNSVPRPLLFLKRAGQVVVVTYLVIGAFATWRSYYQVHSLDLQVDNAVLHPGSTITANLISYGRNRIDVRFDLIQDSHIQTLGSQQVRGNEWALLDPRIRTAAPVVVLSRDVLDQFEPRALVVRITATGRPQWGRTPPPVVREMVMNVQRN